MRDPEQTSELPATCTLHAQKLDALAGDVKQIKVALLGDSFGNHGYKQRMELAEQDIRTIRSEMVKLDVRVSLIAAIVSVGAFVLKHLIWK